MIDFVNEVSRVIRETTRTPTFQPLTEREGAMLAVFQGAFNRLQNRVRALEARQSGGDPE